MVSVLGQAFSWFALRRTVSDLEKVGSLLNLKPKAILNVSLRSGSTLLPSDLVCRRELAAI